MALLPQFLPPGSDPFGVGLLLAGVHGLISGVWFALLIALASALGRRLRRAGTVRAIDGVTGVTLAASVSGWLSSGADRGRGDAARVLLQGDDSAPGSS